LVGRISAVELCVLMYIVVLCQKGAQINRPPLTLIYDFRLSFSHLRYEGGEWKKEDGRGQYLLIARHISYILFIVLLPLCHPAASERKDRFVG